MRRFFTAALRQRTTLRRLAAALAVCGALQVLGVAPAVETTAFVGTYTRGTGSEGIYAIALDDQTGALRQLAVTGGVENPSFLALSTDGRTLYAACEVDEFESGPSGAVAALAVGGENGGGDDGRLKLLNAQPSGGTGPCHVVVDRAGRRVLVANYGGGSTALLPNAADGSLQPATAVAQHRGASVHPDRQTGPHAHGLALDPSENFALVADLGLDQILIYRLDRNDSPLAPADPPFAALQPGAGPRHLAFAHDGRRVYVINELDLTIARFDFEQGKLTPGPTVSVVDEGADRRGVSTAEIAVHPSGKFLYGSIRGRNEIVAYRIDEASGDLTLVDRESTAGETPRHFALDPTGRWLLAANQNSGTIVTLAVDQETGQLSPTGKQIEVPAPVCIVFAPPLPLPAPAGKTSP